MRLTDQVLTDPIVHLLCELLGRGYSFRVHRGRVEHAHLTGANPSAEERFALRTHPALVAAFLEALDAEPTRQRLAAFTLDVIDSTGEERFPRFLFKQDVPLVRGTCFSCGDRLDRPEYGRCVACSLAMRVAIAEGYGRLDTVTVQALDEARVVA